MRVGAGQGDGGGSCDPREKAQDLHSRLGKLLSLDPRNLSAGWRIDAYGLRNPWFYSFDRGGGRLYIGDVGQSAWEEVDTLAASRLGGTPENFMWDAWEGKVRSPCPTHGLKGPGDRVRPITTPALRVRWLVVAAILSLAVPATMIAAASPLEPPPTKAVVQDFESGNILTPVVDDVEVTLTPEGDGKRLTWTAGGPWRANVFYRVYRTDRAGPDTVCLQSGGVAWYCHLYSAPIASTRDTTFVDTSPLPGATYRIGVATNWIDDLEAGDVFAFSPPVSATG